ncbi:MAG: ComF family protein [candidate division Zixibacteria bacterium]|nr:ComF family protein [candidate division Zixibacteria bacterium]
MATNTVSAMTWTHLAAKKLGLPHVLDFIYPPRCLLCGSQADLCDRLLCSDCIHRIDILTEPFCMNCGGILVNGTVCRECPPEDSMPVFALGSYVDPLRSGIHEFKYHGFHEVGRFFAGRLLDAHGKRLAALDPEDIVPIPLYSRREKRRGFNQAGILSDILGNGLQLPVDDTTLWQIRKTRDQARLDPADRWKNIAGAFAVDGDNLAGKRIALVDDVFTTGATMQEARKALIHAGVIPVCGIVLAAAGR